MTALFLGVPVWWVLGLFEAAFFIAAIPMGIYLLRRGRIDLPRGFGIWLLFLIWLFGGLFVLQVDAPGAVPGGSATRYLTFGYRAGWYLISTIAALYVLGARRSITSDKVCAAIAWFFVILVGGGLLGLIHPISFPSALEVILPSSVSRQQFVFDLIHPTTAQMHDFLGSASPRPSAPFAYTNEWGMAMATALPFFVLAWWRRRGAWRWAMFAVLAVSLVPIIASLNRGLWVAIIALVVFTAVRSAVLGRVRLLVGLLALVGIAGVLVVMSPLGSLIQARIDNPHSDEGRTNLSAQAVESALEGSPVIGFGSTRDVAGNFASIAGGATHACPKCEPPPMGTHGQAWLLTFATGFGGLLLFTAFLVGQFVRGLRSTSPATPAALGCLLVMLVTMPFYNSLGVPLFIGFLSIGLLARESTNDSFRARTLARMIGPVRQGMGIVALVVLLGAFSGLLVHQVRGQPVSATQAVLVPAVDLVGLPGGRHLSLDSEALMVRSAPVLDAISQVTGNDDREEISTRLLVGAEPNTRVLTVSYIDADGAVASSAVAVGVEAYLRERSELHAAAYGRAIVGLNARHRALSEAMQAVEDVSGQVSDSGSRPATRTQRWLRAQMALTLSGLHALDSSPDVGHAVTTVAIHRSTDRVLVRVGSGLMVGLVAGVVVAWHFGDRVTHLSRLVRGGQVDGLPIVLTVSATDDAGVEAMHTIGRYRPLCGLLADPESPEAVALASRLAATADGTFVDVGDKALLIVDERAPIRSLDRLRSRCEKAGIWPVGVVVVTNAKHVERSKGVAIR